MYFTYYEICISAHGWHVNRQPDIGCTGKQLATGGQVQASGWTSSDWMDGRERKADRQSFKKATGRARQTDGLMLGGTNRRVDIRALYGWESAGNTWKWMEGRVVGGWTPGKQVGQQTCKVATGWTQGRYDWMSRHASLHWTDGPAERWMGGHWLAYTMIIYNKKIKLNFFRGGIIYMGRIICMVNIKMSRIERVKYPNELLFEDCFQLYFL